MTFEARGETRSMAQQKALNKCYRLGSRRCEIRSCRPIRGF